MHKKLDTPRAKINLTDIPNCNKKQGFKTENTNIMFLRKLLCILKQFLCDRTRYAQNFCVERVATD